MSIDSIKENLSELFLSKKLLFVGIGNPLRGDDGFGPELINRIEGKIKADCINAEMTPENYIGKIVKAGADVVILIDAVSMDEAPATIKLISEDQIPEYGFSTHNMSPKLMIENIKSQISTFIVMIGIQPQKLEFGDSISESVEKELSTLESFLLEKLKK
ncbi:hydrogenase 3 maturation endopeptidase HyCI [Thermoproteota archaeon]